MVGAGRDSGRDGRVLHDTGGFCGAFCKENIQDGGERGTDDLCSCVHCPLKGLVVCCTTVPVPDSGQCGKMPNTVEQLCTTNHKHS